MNNRNAEGYHDPTAAEALANVAREEKVAKVYKPLVYIASPFAGDVLKNIEKACGYCKFSVDKGVIPLAPHLHFPQFMDDGDAEQRELGLSFALILLGKCDRLWAFGSPSEGMKREIARAKKKGIPIHYYNERCEEVHSE